MKALLGCCVLLLVVFAGISFTSVSDADSYDVSTEAELQTILNLAQPGDIIRISNDIEVTGTLIVSKHVVIMGDDPSDPVTVKRVACNYNPIFTIYSGVTFKNLDIDGGGARPWSDVGAIVGDSALIRTGMPLQSTEMVNVINCDVHNSRANYYIDEDGNEASLNRYDSRSGGIYINGASLNVEGSRFYDNVSNLGGAIDIQCIHRQSTLTIKDSVFHDNYAGDENGGAISAERCALVSISDSEFRDNASYWNGGAIGLIDVEKTVISGTSPKKTSFRDNYTESRIGTGIEYDDSGSGGAILCRDGDLDILGNVEFVRNTADCGGAILAAGLRENGSMISLRIIGSRDISGPGIVKFEGNSTVNEQYCSGGAIFASYGVDLYLESVDLVGNSSERGGAVTYDIYSQYDSDLGIGICGSMEFKDCRFSSNYSDVRGGAIYSTTGRMDIDGCTFNNNESGNMGGAVYVSDLFMSTPSHITGSSFTHNSALCGSSLYLINVDVVISYCLLENNTADQTIGVSRGGVIYAGNTINMRIDNTTIQNNAGSLYTGGLYLNPKESLVDVHDRSTLVIGENVILRGNMTSSKGAIGNSFETAEQIYIKVEKGNGSGNDLFDISFEDHNSLVWNGCVGYEIQSSCTKYVICFNIGSDDLYSTHSVLTVRNHTLDSKIVVSNDVVKPMAGVGSAKLNMHVNDSNNMVYSVIGTVDPSMTDYVFKSIIDDDRLVLRYDYAYIDADVKDLIASYADEDDVAKVTLEYSIYDESLRNDVVFYIDGVLSDRKGTFDFVSGIHKIVAVLESTVGGNDYRSQTEWTVVVFGKTLTQIGIAPGNNRTVSVPDATAFTGRIVDPDGTVLDDAVSAYYAVPGMVHISVNTVSGYEVDGMTTLPKISFTRTDTGFIIDTTSLGGEVVVNVTAKVVEYDLIFKDVPGVRYFVTVDGNKVPVSGMYHVSTNQEYVVTYKILEGYAAKEPSFKVNPSTAIRGLSSDMMIVSSHNTSDVTISLDGVYASESSSSNYYYLISAFLLISLIIIGVVTRYKLVNK